MKFFLKQQTSPRIDFDRCDTVESCIAYLITTLKTGDALDSRWAAAALGPLALSGPYQATHSAVEALMSAVTHAKSAACRSSCATSLAQLEWRFDNQCPLSLNAPYAKSILNHLSTCIETETDDLVRESIIDAIAALRTADYDLAIRVLGHLATDDVAWIADHAQESLSRVLAEDEDA